MGDEWADSNEKKEWTVEMNIKVYDLW